MGVHPAFNPVDREIQLSQDVNEVARPFRAACGCINNYARTKTHRGNMRYPLAMIAVLILTHSLSAQQMGSDWEPFLGPFGTSVSPEKGIISPWPKQGL